MFQTKKFKFTYTQIIVFGFFLIIITGGVLLSMPFSSRDGTFTPLLDGIFTAASATCVTGLIVYDTYTHWSLVGQLIILCLIQIGGLGFMTIATMFSMLLKRRIGLKERGLLMEAVNTIQIGGIVLLIKRVLFGTLVIEGIGAILLALRFCPQMGMVTGLYNAVFHSVSAFCNAGFDLMGRYTPFSSLTAYSGDVLVNVVIMSLIVVGGIGFIVWDDVYHNRLCFKKYHLHSKIVLTVTGALILIGAGLFYLLERNNTLMGMGAGEAMLASFFQSVTPRTAGFNTVAVGDFSEGASLLTMILMAIGGSPGSTAGGIKTTTMVVLALATISSVRRTQHLNIFKRRLDDTVVKRASAIFMIYLSVALISTVAICAAQGFLVKEALFEVLSAMGTVGMSTGITQSLNEFSKVLIALLMYSGRVGSLSLVLVLAKKRDTVPLERPVEKIIIG